MSADAITHAIAAFTGADVITCADCDTQLLANPGDTITHNDDGSHAITHAVPCPDDDPTADTDY